MIASWLLAALAPVVMAADVSLAVDEFGEGFTHPGAHDALDQSERERIWREITRREDQLGLTTTPAGIAAPPRFVWPVVGVTDDPGHQAISNFVDHNPGYPDQLTDYFCGDRTYDTNSGYNHDGIDVFLWPFKWLKVDNNEVEVRAAADGTITYKEDGNFDRSCAFGSNRWNAVYLRHNDGSITWYGHLKDGSLTAKPIGATVSAGEYLGVVASSGNSTGPHLHFETFDAVGNLVDPFAGACNTINTESWWIDQPPYADSQLNKLATHDAPPNFNRNNCPAPEQPNYRDRFQPGELAYFVGYFRDQRVAHTASYQIFRPDGSVFDSWTSSLGDADYTTSYWYRSRTLPSNAPEGNWRFEIDYLGKRYQHQFVVGDEHLFTNGFE